MNTIFISTYDNLITIGLIQNDRLIGEENQPSERSHAEHLLPLVDGILQKNRLTIKDLTEIIVVNGPGSFTGVRLGVTVTKTLSFCLKIPIKIISTNEALAISNGLVDKKIISINDPKGKYYGIFENNKLLDELDYLSNEKFADFISNNPNLLIVSNQKLDILAIYHHLKDRPPINPHLVNPVYIKQIEVQNG